METFNHSLPANAAAIASSELSQFPLGPFRFVQGDKFTLTGQICVREFRMGPDARLVRVPMVEIHVTNIGLNTWVSLKSLVHGVNPPDLKRSWRTMEEAYIYLKSHTLVCEGYMQKAFSPDTPAVESPVFSIHLRARRAPVESLD